MVEHRAHDVDDPEVLAPVDLNEGSVLVLWQHKSCLSMRKEVYSGKIVSLKEDVLLLGDELGLQEGADPGNECGGPSIEQIDLHVSLLVNV